MPVAASPRPRSAATGRACRAVVATRLAHPGREFAVQRALAFAWFNTALLLDEDDGIAAALEGVRGMDVAGVVAALDSRRGRGGLREPTAHAPAAPPAGPPSSRARPRSATGLVRYTAPSVVFETADGRRLEAGGFQPLEAYDVLIANLDTTLERHGPPAGPLELLEHFPEGCARRRSRCCSPATSSTSTAPAPRMRCSRWSRTGVPTREPLGDDAIWRAA